MLDNITNNYHCCHPSQPTGRLIPILGLITQTIGDVPKAPQYQKFPLIGGELLVATKFTTIEQLPVSIQPVNAKGQPAEIDGPATWLTDSSDLLTLEPSDDGLTCLIKSTGMPGRAVVQVTCDADLGEGTTPLVGTIDIEVVSAPATSIVVTPGTPEVIPD